MSYYENALKLKRHIDKAAKNVDDATALEIAELYPMWETDFDYEVGDRVNSELDGNLYRCLIAHKSQPDWIPTSAPSLWTRVLVLDETTIYEWVQPDSTNGYSIGDEALHNGDVWISDIDNNVWEPGVYGWTKR